jgi:hypothetical protein
MTRTYIADLTTDELQALIRTTVAEALQNGTPRWVKGIPGIMEIYACSESTAKRIKRSGSIDKAIRQQGRTFMVNATLALQLFGGKTGKHINS